MTDAEIKAAIQDYFATKFQNFGGDELLEGPLNCDEELYDRACELLNDAKITITWRDDEHICVRCGLRGMSFSREFRPGIDEPPF